MSRRRKKRPYKQISARQATAAPESRPGEMAETGKEVSKLSFKAAELTRRDSESSWTPLLAGFLVFLISTPAIVGPYGQQTIGYSPGLHMAAYIQVGGALILSLFLISCFALKRIVVLRSPILLPMVLFYAWAMLSVLWADYKYDAIMDALDWTGAFLGGMLVVLLLRDIKLLHRLFLFLLVSGVLMALLGIGQYLFGIDWVYQYIVPAATFGNKNMAGQYGVMIFPIAVAFFLHSKSEARVWTFAIIISLIMTYIFYTRSRGALLALLTEMIFLSGILIYWKRKHEFDILGNMPTKKVALAVSLALFVGLSALTPSMLGNLSEVLEASVGSKSSELEAEHGGENLKRAVNLQGSADTRITMWGNSIPMFKDHFLIGVGMGNWSKHYGAYQNWYKPDRSLLYYGNYYDNAHNDYVEILCEFGIIGFALFLWLIAALFRAMGRLLASRDKECYLLIVAVVLAVMGIGMNAAFSFPLKLPVSIFTMMVYIAVISNMYGAKFEVGREYVLPRPPKPVIGAAAVVAIIATAGLFVLQYNWYFSEMHYHNAVIYSTQGNYRNTRIETRRAYELNPLRTELLWFEASSLLVSNPSARNKEIVSMLEAVVASRPYLPHSVLKLTQAYANVGRYNDAAETLGGMMKVQPSMFGRYRYGILLFNAGRYEEAIKVLEEVRPELDPKWMRQRMALDQLDEVVLVARGQVARAKAREAKTPETDAVSPSQ